MLVKMISVLKSALFTKRPMKCRLSFLVPKEELVLKLFLLVFFFQKEYRKDLENEIKGKGVKVISETLDIQRAKKASEIVSEVSKDNILNHVFIFYSFMMLLEIVNMSTQKNVT